MSLKEKLNEDLKQAMRDKEVKKRLYMSHKYND